VYVDYSKAFDVVSHNKLIVRLHSYGVRGAVLLWIKNFLSNKTKQTRVEAKNHELKPISNFIAKTNQRAAAIYRAL